MSEVKPGRREMYAALTRAAVLEAATSLFVTNGYDATSVEDIARRSQASKGAVYHHFSEKQEIFAEVFEASQTAVMAVAMQSMSGTAEPWERFELATRAFVHSYVADEAARSLLRQAMGVLGWKRVRAVDHKSSVPFIRATLEEFLRLGVIRPVPLDVAADMLFNLYCNGVLLIADAADPTTTSREVEHMILTMLAGFKSD